MKRIIAYIVLIIISTTLGIIGLKYEKVELPPEDILNKTYYKFNTLTGDYESLKITNNSFEYVGEEFDLNNCNKYTYEEITGNMNLDCGTKLTIMANTDDVLMININNNNYYLYKNKENSFDKEFITTFKESKESFASKTFENIKNKNITENKLKELYILDQTSYVYVKKDTYDYKSSIVESKLNELENSYYINKSDISDFTYIKEEELKTNSPLFIIIETDGIMNSIYTKTIEFNGFNIKDINEYLKRGE